MNKGVTSLDAIFQNTLSSMKDSSHLWEDFIVNSNKLSGALITIRPSIMSYNSSLQTIGNYFYSFQGSKDIGSIILQITSEIETICDEIDTLATSLSLDSSKMLQGIVTLWKENFQFTEKEYGDQMKIKIQEYKTINYKTNKLRRMSKKGDNVSDYNRVIEERNSCLENILEVQEVFIYDLFKKFRYIACVFTKFTKPTMTAFSNILEVYDRFADYKEDILKNSNNLSFIPKELIDYVAISKEDSEWGKPLNSTESTTNTSAKSKRKSRIEEIRQSIVINSPPKPRRVSNTSREKTEPKDEIKRESPITNEKKRFDDKGKMKGKRKEENKATVKKPKATDCGAEKSRNSDQEKVKESTQRVDCKKTFEVTYENSIDIEQMKILERPPELPPREVVNSTLNKINSDPSSNFSQTRSSIANSLFIDNPQSQTNTTSPKNNPLSSQRMFQETLKRENKPPQNSGSSSKTADFPLKHTEGERRNVNFNHNSPIFETKRSIRDPKSDISSPKNKPNFPQENPLEDHKTVYNMNSRQQNEIPQRKDNIESRRSKAMDTELAKAFKKLKF